MHDTLRRLHGGQRGKGTTIDHFRLNEMVSQIAFAGRRGRVYRRIVSLGGVRPGDSVLDVGCEQRVSRQEAGRCRRAGRSRHGRGPLGGGDRLRPAARTPAP